jgi:hypothetical protein
VTLNSENARTLPFQDFFSGSMNTKFSFFFSGNTNNHMTMGAGLASMQANYFSTVLYVGTLYSTDTRALTLYVYMLYIIQYGNYFWGSPIVASTMGWRLCSWGGGWETPQRTIWERRFLRSLLRTRSGDVRVRTLEKLRVRSCIHMSPNTCVDDA